MLVVISIIGANNLHQIMVAMTAYESKYRTLPPGRVGCDCVDVGSCKGLPAFKRPGTSGFALILPELDELVVYQKFCGFQWAVV